MSFSNRTLAAYGQFGMVIAFAGLPIYVHAPKFYADTLGLPLSLLGLLLFLPRLTDAILDPWIGSYSDKLAAKGTSRLRLMAMASPLLGLSFLALFSVPFTGIAAVSGWMVASVFIVYISYSVLLINLNALGAEISSDYHERTRISAWRESFFILGLLVASALPPVLEAFLPTKLAYPAFGIIYLFVLAGGIWVLRSGLAKAKPARPEAPPGNLFKKLKKILVTNAGCRWVLAIGLLNSTASAIPAALVLFYVDDVLMAPEHQAGFLATYFLAGAFGMPVWVRLSKKLGKRGAWAASMLLAILAFSWSFMLGEGDIGAFYLICIFAGISLGADYTLPLSLLADIIAPSAKKKSGETGIYMGLWVLNAKLSTALSTAIALPLLAALGYQPGNGNSMDSLAALSAVYALIPCVLKLGAAALLWSSPLDRRKT